MTEKPFWQTKKLEQMTEAEWESVCDGCAKCCLVKLQNEDTGEIAFTDLACRGLDLDSCRCSHYAQRSQLVPDCVTLTKANLPQIDFMPPSCAYRLLHEGKDLPHWHPLVTGKADSTIAAGMSVHGRVTPEILAGDDIEAHIVSWPMDEKNADKDS